MSALRHVVLTNFVAGTAGGTQAANITDPHWPLSAF